MEHNSWEPQENIHAPDLVVEFHQRHPGAVRHIRMTDFLFLPFQPTTVPRRHISEGGGRCQGTPNLNPKLYPSSTICTSTPSPTSDKDWLTPFLCFLCFSIFCFSIPPKLQNSLTLLRKDTTMQSTTQSLHYFISLFLCSFISLFL